MPNVAHVDRAVADLAARQHGIVARHQLVELGLGHGAIDHRVRCGRLHPVYRGVYSVGHPVPAGRAGWLAAVLAYGPGALLSHTYGGALWGLAPTARSRIDVTVPGRRGRGRPGIVLHRVRRLEDADRSIRDGIPVTSLPRTLLDLAEVLSLSQLARAFEQAERLCLLDVRALEAMCERNRGRHGLHALRTLLDEAVEPSAARSELEHRFAGVCREAKLPAPALNVVVAGFEVDALFRRGRLIVELDGFAYHRSRASFERDRMRDSDLQLAGYRVLRITARRLDRAPSAVAAAVRALLATNPPRPA